MASPRFRLWRITLLLLPGLALGAAVLSAIKGDKTTKAALDDAAREIDGLLRG